MEKNTKRLGRIARHKRIRNKLKGTPERPRMTVFRSARHISVQMIDDIHAVTIAGASTLSPAFRSAKPEGDKKEAAKWVGREVAKKAREKGVEKVLFDRGGYKFHGRVKALADAAREAGIRF